ncbi:MAG TPA: hypothetical protein VIF15_01000 [Polyangiaceae bacterium]|jgi:hypothetical protein
MNRRWLAFGMVVTAACARAASPEVSPSGSGSATASATGSATATATAAATATGSATPPATASATAAATPEPPLEGADFLPEAKLIYRVAACGAGGEVPARFDAAVVTRHCDELGHAYDEYRRGWVDVARPFLAALRPRDLPRVAVYPFGGGDLVSALATFPDATEITTISLEPAGDVRPVDSLAPDFLAHELAVHRAHLERLFEKAHSRTDNLEKESRTELPGELLFALAALVVHGDEPVGLRYFRLQPDGSVAYVTAAEIASAKKPGERRAVFANAELRFRRAGEPGAPVQVLRHVSFNLDDAHLKADPALLAHLAGKGKVAAMTKAATHLLWNDHFSLIRGWLVGHTDWMVSDSTGIPPRIAGPAGFTQDTYGTFVAPSPFGNPDGNDADDVKKLFASQPARDLPFRYGYPDRDGHAHLIVTHRAPH